jgi:hypothetical protein
MLLTALAVGKSGHGGALLALPMMALTPLAVEAASVDGLPGKAQSTCGDIKKMYKASDCCGKPEQVTHFQLTPMPTAMKTGDNYCKDKKKLTEPAFDNFACVEDGLVKALDQAGMDVTTGYKGQINATGAGRLPATKAYWEIGLCPVNVHWHLGTEHRSIGEFDEGGKHPTHLAEAHDDHDHNRRLAFESNPRHGFSCYHYDKTKPEFTTEYDWKFCVNMHVGETYEIHWPHSAAGACGTPHQFQSPFYDGVFCNINIILSDPRNLWDKVGVQAQVFTVVNDEKYYYPDLMRGMIVDGDFGKDIAKYTGSTTGPSRNNTICSAYTPITWQVDRKCHLISASSFDKMCADMMTQYDDMSDDLYPHGARELAADNFTANNLHRRLHENEDEHENLERL